MIPLEGLLYLIPVTLLSYFLVTLCARCSGKGSSRNQRNVETVIEPETLIQVSYQPASCSTGHLSIDAPNHASPLTARRYNLQGIDTPPEPTYAEPVEVVSHGVNILPSSSEVHRRRDDLVDSVSLPPSEPGSDGGESSSDIRTEISYNKISVREPLARVLAERAAMEHTYTEVDGEEGLSSFYEEIAGSATSSVTYTKIGEVSVIGPSSVPQHASRDDVIVVDVPGPSSSLLIQSSPLSSRRSRSESIPTPPPPPSVESLLVVAKTASSSRSASPQQSIHSNHDIHPLVHHNHFVHGEEAYALIDKSTKNRGVSQDSSGSDSPPETDALYARVEKASPSMNGLRNSHRERNPPPLPSTPPPPPPVPSSLKNLLRGPRAVSMINPSTDSTAFRNHQRRYSSEAGDSSPPVASFASSSSDSNRVTTATKVQTETVIEDPGYEVVKNDDYEMEPGYEEIGRRQDQDSANGHFYDRPENVYSDGSIADPGYEVVGHYIDSDADPGYEIITKRKAPPPPSFTPPDPEYEVIKRSPHPLPPAPVIQRQESDVSNEPGYERVLFVPRKFRDQQNDQHQPKVLRTFNSQLSNGLGPLPSSSRSEPPPSNPPDPPKPPTDHSYAPLIRKPKYKIEQEFYERL